MFDYLGHSFYIIDGCSPVIVEIIYGIKFKTLCTIKAWTTVSFRHTQTSGIIIWISTMVMIKVQCMMGAINQNSSISP